MPIFHPLILVQDVVRLYPGYITLSQNLDPRLLPDIYR
jgi:hypothetical protein